ncbi:fuculose phosphate aldolase [Salinigranum rubrum]|uniref:Fuculose phosphate aldolase n=1 Tax=Salinigranum rubrum TaxID=755307 RepID=A0A2I8VFX4_9EURY|nr:class II aldolase/adducin family protein [Salinigranum rubrum]AUV80837.1 fuculose phosphate aldolase [Salinigranum rubrum]
MSQELSDDGQRRTVAEYGRQMLEQGLTKGTGGNISASHDGRVAISPTGVPYDEIEADDVPVLDEKGNKLDGDTDPSSEFRMHTAIHRERDDVGGVVHTHSPYASTFASLGEPIPASHYLIAFAGDQVPVAGYATYGTADLADLALDALGDEYNACLLDNHGVLAVGPTVEAAFEVALMVEYCARIHYQAISLGDPAILPDDEVDRLRTLFEDYGQAADDDSERVAPDPDPDHLPNERQAVADLGRQMLADGLTKGTGGNVSARSGDHVAVNPSGVPYRDVTAETVPIVTVDGEQVAGPQNASSETPMHTAIYRERDDVGGVVHTHSPYASTFASLDEPIPASHYLIAFIGDQVPVAGYEPPGSEALGREAVDALGDEYNACLLKNHGVIAVGESVEAAYEVALMVEYCARIHYQAASVGDPKLLPDAEIDNLLERFANYGQDH